MALYYTRTEAPSAWQDLFYTRKDATLARWLFTGVPRSRKTPTLLHHHRSLGMVLLQGPTGWRFLMSEQPLYYTHTDAPSAWLALYCTHKDATSA